MENKYGFLNIKSTKIKASNATIEKIVDEEIKRLGKGADLNHIDVSEVTNMTNLFEDTGFYGDVSKWDVSRVEEKEGMFIGCPIPETNKPAAFQKGSRQIKIFDNKGVSDWKQLEVDVNRFIIKNRERIKVLNVSYSNCNQWSAMLFYEVI